MTDTLLRSLRERLLDETEPLAGLLRKCLLLGAETGSKSLRQWARDELNGYDHDAELPAYRKLPTPVIHVDYVSGLTVATNQPFNRLQLPLEAQKGVPEFVPLHQPIEELDGLSAQKSLSFTGTGLAYAQTVWNDQLEWPQQITAMRFSLSSSAISGVLGQIRTQLVDVVADLTADTPLADLPGKDQVDAAFGQHIGTQYITTVHGAHGSTAIGTGARAKSEGVSAEDAIRLLDAVRTASEDVSDESAKTELLEAVEELRVELKSDASEPGAVVKKAGKLRAAATAIGIPALSSAVGGAVEAVIDLAMSGAFG